MSVQFGQSGLLGAVTSLGGMVIEGAESVLVSERQAEIARAQAQSAASLGAMQSNQTTMLMLAGGVLIGIYLLNR